MASSKFKFFTWFLLAISLFLLYKFIKKDSLIDIIYLNLPPKEAGLLSGMVLGDKSGFDKNFLELLKRSGVIHIVVVSGSNIMLLAKSLIESLAKLIGRGVAIIFGLITIWSYTAIVGWEIPVLRASLLISIYYWAQILGRKYSITRSLGLTILIMLLADYTMLTQISFWLSFGAFVAIVLKPKSKGNFITDNLISTLWVSLWVTPILAFSLGQVSIISFLSNAMIIELVEIITMIGGVGILIGIFSQFLGKIILLSIYPLLKYLVVIVESIGSLSWATIKINFNIWILIGWYLIFFGYLYKKNHEN